MTINILYDSGKWCFPLEAEAKSRGWDTKIIRTVKDANEMSVAGDSVFFARISQKASERIGDMRIIEHAYSRGARIYPEIDLLQEYEDKGLQYFSCKQYLPETDIYIDAATAFSDLGRFGYPFVSKSKTGSASCNVRLVANETQAREEIELAFGPGLKAPHGLGELIQKDYLIWQEFLAGNPYDYRACIVGNHVMLLRRKNRDSIPFASGSGDTEPITELDDETRAVLDFSFRFFDALGYIWCGIDLVKDINIGKWRMLETTIAWKQSAYSDCVFFARNGAKIKKKGKEIWSVFCDYIGGRA